MWDKLGRKFPCWDIPSPRVGRKGGSYVPPTVTPRTVWGSYVKCPVLKTVVSKERSGPFVGSLVECKCNFVMYLFPFSSVIGSLKPEDRFYINVLSCVERGRREIPLLLPPTSMDTPPGKVTQTRLLLPIVSSPTIRGVPIPFEERNRKRHTVRLHDPGETSHVTGTPWCL